MPKKTTPTISLAIAILHGRGYLYGGITEHRVSPTQCYDWGGRYRIDETVDGRPKVLPSVGWRDLELMTPDGEFVHVQVGARSAFATKIATVESCESARMIRDMPGHAIMVLGIETKPRSGGAYHYREAVWTPDGWVHDVKTFTPSHRQLELA